MKKVIPILSAVAAAVGVTPLAHARLSCSGSERWIACTRSVVAEEPFPNEDTDYTLEGTLAHDLGSMHIQAFLDGGFVTDEQELARATELGHQRFINAAFKSAVLDYVRRCILKISLARSNTPDAKILIEQRLDVRRWVPDGFGTGDLVIVSDELCDVTDLKFGQGVKVDVEDNSQLMLYGLGAIAMYRGIYDFKRVRISIDQPRMNNIDHVEYSVAELLEWGETVVKPRAEMAHHGLGEFVPGPHCSWCRARHTCRARAEDLMAMTDQEFETKPEHLSKQEIEALLPKLDNIIAMAKALQQYAYKEAVNGKQTWNGWKLVEGKSNRVITDPQALANSLVLVGGIDRALLMTPPELVGIGEMEKLVGKKLFAEIGAAFIKKPTGAPALVPSSDKRPEWTQKGSADEEFGD